MNRGEGRDRVREKDRGGGKEAEVSCEGEEREISK